MKNIHFNTMLSECAYCVVDIETGSVSTPSSCGIIEIAGVRIEPGFTVDMPGAWSSLINPKAPIEPAATVIHGITDEMVADAPDERTVMKELATFLRDAIFIAHNAPFDHGYISRAMKAGRVASPIQYIIDTLAISRRLHPEFGSHSLDALIQHYGLESPRLGGVRHRALYDADLTAILFVRQISELEEYGIYTLGDIFSFIRGGIY